MNAPDGPLPTGLPAPGERIADKYDVVRVVGEGGMGIVYEVMHTRLQQRAAIKMLQPRLQAMPEVAARFEREARAACRLRSRHAVRVTDVDHDARGRAYMVMEFLEGHDLAQELHARGKLPYVEAVEVVLQACIAMAEAHESGVIHRDLKPSNLFLVPEGGEQIVKVLDFGISKLTTDGEEVVTSTFATMGTPLYMSPEQIRSTKNVDGRTDIWSLGVILYETIAGERPFQGTVTAAAAAIVEDEPTPLRRFVPELPEGLEAAVMKALSKKSEGRFADMRAFVEALAPFVANRDALRAIEASGLGGTLRPPMVRPASMPAFVHATTLAQTTPPPVVGAMRPPLAQDGAPVHAEALALRESQKIAAPVVAPSTGTAWATQRTSAGRAGRAARVVAIGLVITAAATLAFLEMRGTASSPTPAPSAAASIAPPTPPPSSPSSSASTSASTQPPPLLAAPLTSAPPHHTPRPHAPPSHPVSSPSSAPSSAAPATTNPLHL